jgi:2-polyprenyl-3-methyl-5-hydroxy-6-metoxy-1,4-benzoquinol methylase
MDTRRVYYDHEPAYRKIEAQGGRGWDDLKPAVENAAAYEAIQSFLASGFIPLPGRDVSALDVGCGGGQVAVMLAERGYTAYGVDYSETAIQLAERNAREAGVTIDFSVSDCLRLEGFESETMDLAVDNHVLHCFIGAENRLAFLRTVYRVLKPGGILFSETGSCEGNFDAAAVEANPATRISRCHTRYWVSLTELGRELEVTGFCVLNHELRGQEYKTGANIVTYAQRPAPGE